MKRIFLIAAILCCMGPGVSGKQPVYKDVKAPIEQRVEDLLSRMTLHEKVLQLQNRVACAPEELEACFHGKSVGTVHEMGHDAAACQRIIAGVQEYMRRHTRLGIPVIPCVEGIQGVLQDGATLFPHALAQGSTFNPALIERMTEACGREAAAMGFHQILSPVLDLARDLRWGRVEETFGEDPYLTAEMGIGYVRGYQKLRISCMPKHFVAHGSPTGGLNCAQVSGGERELRNLYLYPFARVIAETDPMAVMSCYSAYDGVPVSGSRYFMTDILRGELGFRGYVYSDWGSVERLRTFHHAVETDAEAARQSLLAGIDLDVDPAYQTLEEQVEKGLVGMDAVDRAVRRILRAKFALGIFDAPYGDARQVEQTVRCAAHVALAKEVADESAVLLENKGILPLDLTKYRSIAVVGPNSDHAVYGDYSWVGSDAKEGVSLYQGLRNVLGDKVVLRQADGCDWWSQDAGGIAEAVAAVEQSDLAIVAIGTRSTYLGRAPRHSTSGEGFDLSSLELPGRQLDLLKAVEATGKPMVVVFISGKPLVLSWVKEHAEALLVQWYGGEQQGNSAADILVGNVNPSGRLNVSFPRSTGNTPCYYNYYPTDREYGTDRGGTPESPGHRYIFEEPYALWSFGYGLSYTHYEYTDCRIRVEGERIIAEVDVENCGDRDGKEVVQLYVNDPIRSVAAPVRQLKAFRKVAIRAGEKTTVRLEVPFRELMFTDERLQRVFEPGEFEIQIGSSSDRILFRKSIRIGSDAEAML